MALQEQEGLLPALRWCSMQDGSNKLVVPQVLNKSKFEGGSGAVQRVETRPMPSITR